MDYSTIITAVLYNESSIAKEMIYDHEKTKVYLLKTASPMIMRVAAGAAAPEIYKARLLDELAGEDGLAARILHQESRDIDGSPWSIQIQTYIPGNPVEAYPGGVETEAIVHAVHQLHTRLNQAAARIGTDSLQAIHTVVSQILPMVPDCPIKDAAKRLSRNVRYTALLSGGEQTIIYGDLWYKNLLLEKRNAETVVRFVDIDPLVLGPAILQPAILFSSYFLFLSCLLEPGDGSQFELGTLLSCWPEPLDEADILLMMLVFPVGLGLLKEFQFLQTSDSNLEKHRRTMAPFEKSITLIERLMTERGLTI